jgi:phosphoenolpyruvate carboxykinase (ATP)
MLIERVKRHHSEVWMLNTGWVGGAYGVGQRMSIAHTRAIVRAVVQGKLHDVPTHTDPIFGLQIPDHVPEVPTEVLDPRGSWADPDEYDRQAKKLRTMFEENIHTIGRGGSTAG